MSGLQQKEWAPRPTYTPQTLQCPSCGGNLQRFSEHSQLQVCSFCNERLELTHAEVVALGKSEQVEFDQFTLDVGQTFVWNDIEYTVIGRVSFLDSERDPGPKDYLLFHPQFGTLWATEYWGYGYYITKRSRMLPPKEALEGSGRVTMPDGSTWKFSERETYTIEQVDGALPYIAKVGDQVDILELQNTSVPTETMAIERTNGADEVECTISTRIPRMQWKKAAGQYTEADERRAINSNMPIWARLIGAAACILTIWMLVMDMNNQKYSEGLKGFQYFGDGTNQEMVTETFTLTDVSGPVGFQFEGYVDNSWMGIQYAVLSSPIEGPAMTYQELLAAEQDLPTTEQSTIRVLSDVEISYYHGVDGGESWSEGGPRTTEKWVFPEGDTGPFRLLLSSDRSFSVTVMQNDQDAGKFFGGIFVAVLMFVVFITEPK